MDTKTLFQLSADIASEHYRMKKEYREQIIQAVREYNEKYNKA